MSVLLRLTAVVLLIATPTLAEPVFAPKPKKLPDLPGFRTTKTAITAKIGQPTAKAPAGQPGYIGLAVRGESGRVVVSELVANSPAESAGLRAGDAIVTINKETVSAADELREIVQGTRPGEQLAIQATRKNNPVKFVVTVEPVSRPVTPTARSRSTRQRAVLGVNLGPSEKPKGLKLVSVWRGLPAQLAGLKTGDVILKVEGKAVAETRDLLLSLARKRPGDTISLLVAGGEGKKDRELKIKLAGRGSSSSRRTRSYWSKPSYRLAIIGIEYPDVKHNPRIEVSDWNDSFFSRNKYNKANATGQVVYGSMNDYYDELSVGKLEIKGKMFEWVEVSKKRAEYSPGSGTSRRNKTVLLVEALNKLTERDGKDALKDYDGVVFLYAGSRYRTSRGGLYWPHRSSVTFKGRPLPYFICPEGGRRMTNISVFCHEFGHMLGLPDLYARPENPGSEGVSVWCAMSNQLGNGRPQHFSAWCKEKLGWVKPSVIDPRVKQKLVLSPVEKSSSECFKVLLREDGSEYLLLENRRKIGWDKGLPAEGLLIWRIVNGRPFLQESHGITGPSGPRVYRDLVPYPSRSNRSFTPYTTPSSRAQLGGGLPVHITNIRELPDGRVTFYVGYEFH